MTVLTVAAQQPAHPLEPVRDTVLGLSRGAPLVTLGDDDGATWYPASWLTDPDGPVLAGLLDLAAQRWGLGRHGAAAIAFKGYAWSATLPVVAGLFQHRRVPMMESAGLRVGIADRLPYVRFDLSAVEVAVLPDDPAGNAATAGTVAVDDRAALLAATRSALLHGHLAEAVAAMHAATRVGTRPLWGSVAEAVAFAALQMPSDDPARSTRDLLVELGEPLTGLVDVLDDAGGPAVRRRTCCLWFTGEAGRDEYCSTCCIVR